MERGNNKRFGVVIVQMYVIGTKDQNIKHAADLIRTAYHHYQPKLIVLPEYFNSKWGKQHFDENAELIPTGETTTILAKLAKELQIYLVAGSIPERDTNNKQTLYNTTTVFAPTGNLIAKYRKIHLFDMEVEQVYQQRDVRPLELREAKHFEPGNQLVTFDMDGVKIGLGIGYDMSFGELATLYRKQGVDMIIYPASYPTSLGTWQWEHINRSRAIDNQVYVLGVSQARTDINTDYIQHGRSMLTDFSGRVIARAGDDEELVYVLLDINELDVFREQFPLYEHKRNDIYDAMYRNQTIHMDHRLNAI